MNEKFLSKGIVRNYVMQSCNENVLKFYILHTEFIRVHVSVVVPSTKLKMLLFFTSSLSIMLDI